MHRVLQIPQLILADIDGALCRVQRLSAWVMLCTMPGGPASLSSRLWSGRTGVSTWPLLPAGDSRAAAGFTTAWASQR